MVFGRKLVGKLDYLQNFNDYLLKCSVGKLLISCSMKGQKALYSLYETVIYEGPGGVVIIV